MVYRDVSARKAAEAHRAHAIPNPPQAGDHVVVCPHPLHTQDGVLELITLVRTAQMHAHVVDEEDLLADLGIGMLTDGVTENQVRQATVVRTQSGASSAG